MVPDRLDNDKRPHALYAFLWALLLSACIVVPVMIYDNGYFLYYGDFNVQQIPFYQLAHDSIQNGDVGWSHLTDLGANFVGSYSFYLLGSPFFWLTVLLPSAWVSYSIGPLLMLKLAFASLSAYIYIRRYVRHKKFAVIGGVLYAFSGFSIYNIFFFHFHEAMIFFPLLLAALDEFHSTKRRGIVALAVFACATVNYYFFFGQVVFAAIYYVVKLISKSYRFRFKEFISLTIECVIGFFLSMFLLLPSVAAIVGNSRVSQIINGWDALIYPKTQRYMQIFVSMFFPGDVPAKNNFTSSAGGKWSSVAAYLPMFSMTFVIAYLHRKKRGFFRRMILILLIMAAVPGLNSVFQCLNNTYYARWFYMLTLMTALVTVQSLDNLKDVDFKRGIITTAAITAATALVVGFLPWKKELDGHVKVVTFGLEETPLDFWVFAGAAVIGLALTLLVYVIYRINSKFFFRATALCLSLFIAAYSVSYIWIARRYADRDDNFMISYALNQGKNVTLDDINETRSDFYDTSDNIGMYWQVPTIQAFHSIVPGSLIDFYNKVGVSRTVGSRPDVEYYGLRGLLSVKYFFVEEQDDPEEETHLLPGFHYINTQNGYDIYENQYYIPMGFTYDTYFTEEEFTDLQSSIKHLSLLKALVLSQEDMKKYADITGYTDGMYLNLNFSHNENNPQDAYRPSYDGFDSITAEFEYNQEEYKIDAQRLKENSCSSFNYTNEGFNATFTNKGKDNLLFFSVPYDEGWSATVNGEPADIAKVNIGFMAVRVPGNKTSEIQFRYKTPLLTEGCILSGAALGAFIIYLIINKGPRKKRGFRRVYKIKQKSNA